MRQFIFLIICIFISCNGNEKSLDNIDIKPEAKRELQIRLEKFYDPNCDSIIRQFVTNNFNEFLKLNKPHFTTDNIIIRLKYDLNGTIRECSVFDSKQRGDKALDSLEKHFCNKRIENPCSSSYDITYISIKESEINSYLIEYTVFQKIPSAYSHLVDH